MGNYPLAINFHAVADAAHDWFGRLPRRQHQVLFCQPVPWMHDAIRHLAVIREEQESLRVPIEPANREQPELARWNLHARSPVAFFARRRDVVAWLVIKEISNMLARYQFAAQINTAS